MKRRFVCLRGTNTAVDLFQVPRLYFTAREVSNSFDEVGSGENGENGDEETLEGSGVVVVGQDEPGIKGRRPVLMSRAMRDFAGLDQASKLNSLRGTGMFCDYGTWCNYVGKIEKKFIFTGPIVKFSQRSLFSVCFGQTEHQTKNLIFSQALGFKCLKCQRR